jgi:dTDP-4-amino-4,6-dideoxygalactose transaminase
MSEHAPATPHLIAQADPSAAYKARRAEIDAAVKRVLESAQYIIGQEGAQFESEFARWLGAPFAIGCANGTDALMLALRAAGVVRGDPVATVSHTAVATVAAIEAIGAVPVLLDIDPLTYTLDPNEFDALLSDRSAQPIKAVVVVHLYGQPAAMDRVVASAARHGVTVIEDCAQAHGARFGDRAVGLWGLAAAFSFYPTKNLAAFGDAGAVVVRDDDLAQRLRRLRQYGWNEQRLSQEPGINSRLDELQAAVLRVQLRQLDADNARRRAIADAYDSALAGGGRAQAPVRRADRTHVFHQYVVRHRQRDALRDFLRARGVGSAVHYATPLHRHPAYADRLRLGPAACRATDEAVAEILSLPMHPHLTDDEVDRVCAALAVSV